MSSRVRPTLRQVFSFSLLGLLLALATLFYLVLDGTEQTIIQTSDRYRDLASHEVAQQVTLYLGEAPLAVSHFEQEVKNGLVMPKVPDSVEQCLFSLLLENGNISEATLTYGNVMGMDTDGNVLTDRSTAGQVAVLRSATSGDIIGRRTWFEGGRFASSSGTLPRRFPPGMLMETTVPSMDPTSHPTFQTPASKKFFGHLLWADLHWAQIDEILPEPQRRVEVSVQKTIEDAQGHFAGVLRVGLMKSLIDRAVEPHLWEGKQKDPHLIFICDSQGRLITGFGKKNRVADWDEDLRIPAADVPPVVQRALREPALNEVDSDQPVAATSFRFDGMDYLATFRALPETQDWIVGIVVPRNFYLGSLLQIRQQVLAALVILILIIFLAGGLIIRSIVMSHSRILHETVKMNQFDFSPSGKNCWLRDTGEVLAGLEKGKTAMRAMSKYVPVNLVRQLYTEGQEPVLGGKAAEISLLFTDIKGFTAFAEKNSADRAAAVLGKYLETMAEAIQAEKGTIDKYIGDSVMALWNAPEEVPNHEVLVCRAALRCEVALRKLYTSHEWGDAPPFDTRYGIHRSVASVGHFGSPDRFNYTAIGDGVNLASRLEGLSRHYGTTVIASEDIYERAKDDFVFRLLDRVAVKGKTQGITIYEVISEIRISDGESGIERPAYVSAYEEAFGHYQGGCFQAALDILERQPEDAPSRVIAERCRTMLAKPPDNWTGIWVFDTK
jgi:adenylate cyclase